MATLETRLIALANAIGADIKSLRAADGTLTSLTTTAKGSLVAAINELHGLVSAAGATINDAAGDGNVTETWSADKIGDSIAAATAALRTELTSGAAAALDTFAELATALGNDPSFAATVATSLSNRVRFDAAQVLDGVQQTQARANIGAAEAAAFGNPDADLVSTYNTAKA